MNDNSKKVIKGIGNLVVLLVMAWIVSQKINSINELSIIGWILVAVSFVVVVFCSIKMSELLKPHINLKENTLEWLSISVCFILFGLAAYLFNTQSINDALFSKKMILEQIEKSEQTYQVQKDQTQLKSD
jgi:O-antigen/teichoic acid export membrane protein